MKLLRTYSLALMMASPLTVVVLVVEWRACFDQTIANFCPVRGVGLFYAVVPTLVISLLLCLLLWGKER